MPSAGPMKQITGSNVTSDLIKDIAQEVSSAFPASLIRKMSEQCMQHSVSTLLACISNYACAGKRIREYEELMATGIRKMNIGHQDLKDIEDEAEGEGGASGKRSIAYMLAIFETANSHCVDLRPTFMPLSPPSNCPECGVSSSRAPCQLCSCPAVTLCSLPKSAGMHQKLQ